MSTTRTNIALVAVGLGLILIIAAITAATIHIAAVAARRRRDAVRASPPSRRCGRWPRACGASAAQYRDPGRLDQRRQADHGAVAAPVGACATGAVSSGPAHPVLEPGVPRFDLLTDARRGRHRLRLESSGQVTVQGTSFSPGVDAVLHRSTASLARAGWSTRSAWITSPGFGGIRQLSHSTLQSGLWVNAELRYADLVASRPFTLSDAFDKADWRTVSDGPRTTPSRLPARGSTPSTALQPFQPATTAQPSATPRRPTSPPTPRPAARADPGGQPVMAEIDTVSSHAPWAPLPTMVPWNKVGNGSIFNAMPARSESPITV